MNRLPTQDVVASLDQVGAGSAPKRAYSKPLVVCYGRVEEMTRGGGKSKTEFGGKPLKGT